MNFWEDLLKQPIIGLSPMDGVTDAAYRYVHKKYGNPDVVLTEFVSVDGIIFAGERLLVDFIYDDIEHPIAAQVFGNDPELFFRAAHVICELGFDGMDINMGCPAKSVSERGCGAGLIRTPEVAKEIVRASKRGIKSWVENGIEAAGLRPGVVARINTLKEKHNLKWGDEMKRKEIPVSVKTRVGYDEKIAPDWIKHLSEVDPTVISLHGRTLKQMYTGQADWDEIGRAVESTHIPILGNGDVQNANDAVYKIKNYGVKGVLIGRATYGNPWLFKKKGEIHQLKDDIEEYVPTTQEKIQVVIEHAKRHWEIKGEKGFVQMRKNLAWYFKSIHNASDLRTQLVRVNTPQEVIDVLNAWNFETL
jgi:tRNA-dihydrouridine synthase B